MLNQRWEKRNNNLLFWDKKKVKFTRQQRQNDEIKSQNFFDKSGNLNRKSNA